MESHPEFAEVGEVTLPALPFTSLSKSISGSSDGPLLTEKAFVAAKDMKSSFPDAFVPFDPPSSCSFLVCSDSTRVESVFINSIKDLNWFRSRSGPKLIDQRTGNISNATKSPSATPPTSRRTLSAAMATAGSFVLIPLIKGTIFSCIVYLSRAVDDDFLFVLFTTPLSPSLLELESLGAPQRIAKASRPRTLIPRLLVFVKTEAMTGNNSFLIVEKSRIGRMIGKLRSAASTMVCVGDSMAKCMIGSMSGESQFSSSK